jgi:acylphosphatase
MIKACAIRVSGRVQGVYFRASTKDEADRLGVKGIVRNERDGSVYIEAEGEDEPLNKFLEWCKHGPPSARVEHCDIKTIEWKGYQSFDIKR